MMVPVDEPGAGAAGNDRQLQVFDVVVGVRIQADVDVHPGAQRFGVRLGRAPGAATGTEQGGSAACDG